MIMNSKKNLYAMMNDDNYRWSYTDLDKSIYLISYLTISKHSTFNNK